MLIKTSQILKTFTIYKILSKQTVNLRPQQFQENCTELANAHNATQHTVLYNSKYHDKTISTNVDRYHLHLFTAVNKLNDGSTDRSMHVYLQYKQTSSRRYYLRQNN
jgi:hypothetical protein